ncbi:Hsp70 family protein [Albibacillus kandeliae]|uniref:Hsp70 family protein n=1 Tax=Albibacillus kandeliae TaxID=2174228 RepID=UPI000D68744A|nr:Hsp70 family protein [Albibacillus kandeliae]
MTAPTLAVDFGTSNTAAAVLQDGRPCRIAIEEGSETLPTAVFFPADAGVMRIGAAASDALIAGEEGRYMRALKSVLGTSLFHETRRIEGKRRTLADTVTAFLVALKSRAEAETGERFSRVLSGRPVHFHTADPERDARAEADLRACYHAAGFESVEFLFEPEAAALASHGLGTAGDIGLIVDIGGGTSDFSVFRTENGRPRILASHGIRLGGTDFDHAVSMSHAMPLLGLGGELRRDFGEGLLPVPRAIYMDLSTWAKIPFLYTRETLSAVADMVRLAVDAPAMRRLEKVLGDELGHDLAFSVEEGKIAANANRAGARIGMAQIAPRLSAPIDGDSLDAALETYRAPLSEAAAETLQAAGISPAQVGTVILVGGSSLMNMVSDGMRALCPGAEQRYSEAFTAVVDGLALATEQA